MVREGGGGTKANNETVEASFTDRTPFILLRYLATMLSRPTTELYTVTNKIIC
jgi:hypothetical protein